jgi:glutathione S-transferase
MRCILGPMALEVYWGSGSPFSWRVLLALEIKGIKYESKLIEFSKQQHKTPEFLTMNPRGAVPTVRDGDFSVYESVAIVAYLDRKFPEPPLFGRTPEEYGRIWQLVQECVAYIDSTFERVILPFYERRSDEAELDVRGALPSVKGELARLEGTLGARQWLAGPALTAADVVTYPMVRSLQRAAEKPEAARFDIGLLPIPQRYPAIARWMGAVEALPGYDRTFPPHWRA